jgi:NADH-quinone oxidoreductase subunit N
MTADLFLALLPEQLVLALLLGLMVLDMLRTVPHWGRAAFAAVMLAGLAVLLQQWAAGGPAAGLPGELQVDRLAVLGKLLLLGCGLALALGFREPGLRQGGHKFWLLLASSLLGGMVILDSAGFATLFIGIEMLSLPVFALMVHGQREHASGAASEGAFKYLLMSSVGTALLLLGVSLAYGSTGSLAIMDFALSLAGGSGQSRAAGLLVLCGLFVKAAVFPFHAWAPDAYASTRIQVTAVLASLVKAAVVLALLRITASVPLDATSTGLVAALAIASIVFGNLAALGQARFKRMLAYSSVAHAGYMIFALVDTTGARSEDLLWYLAFYALATLVACAAFAALCPEGTGADGNVPDDDMAALHGSLHRQPVAALLLVAAVLSLAGLPPFPGFFAKLFVFRSVVASGHLWAAAAAFVGSFLGLAFYMRVVLLLFATGPLLQRPAAPPRPQAHPAPG